MENLQPATESDTSLYLDRTSSTPLYVQLKMIMMEKISSQEWPANSVIPSERDLCNIYGISRMTARSVITQMVAEGMLYRIPGKGTYVSEGKYEIRGSLYGGLRQQLEEQGGQVSTVLLSVSKMSRDTRVEKTLHIQPNEPFYFVERLRYVNQMPVCYYKTYIPAALCPGLENMTIEAGQLCAFLESKYSLDRTNIKETLESYIADDEKAKLLDIPTGFPLLLLEDISSTRENIYFEYTRVYFRGDKIKLSLNYHNP